MNKKIIASVLMFFLLIMCISINSFANTLDIGVSTDKKAYTTGDEINVIVSWSEGMQAAGFKLNYDSNKIKFVSTNIAESFYNTKNERKIEVAWASFDDKDSTQINFVFKAINEGTCDISLSDPAGFADGNLETPDAYDISTNGKTSIQIKNESGQVEIDKSNEEKPKADQTVTEKTEQAIPEKTDQAVAEKTDETVINKTHPNTGIESTIFFIIFAITIITIISYWKYKNLKNI